MSDIKGTIKILENKIIIKSEGGVENWIKRSTLFMDTKEWIEFRGNIYELEKFDDEDSL